jgi:hypothetical protein
MALRGPHMPLRASTSCDVACESFTTIEAPAGDIDHQ